MARVLTGNVLDEEDVECIFISVMAGKLPININSKHLTKPEQQAIDHGTLYVFDSKKVRRWTDDRLWNSESQWHFRNIIKYREMETVQLRDGTRRKQDKANGLIKTIVAGKDDYKHLRIAYYYRDQDGTRR
eukprot:Clim_evm91s147 gene=Clim_evmTU91s147